MNLTRGIRRNCELIKMNQKDVKGTYGPISSNRIIFKVSCSLNATKMPYTLTDIFGN